MKTLFGEKGFTLIEMLLVLTLIAAIVGVALPSFRAMQQEGNMTRAKGDLRTLQTAVESYYIHNEVYPTALTNLTADTTIPKIVTSIPNDPFDPANIYQWDLNADGLHYVIFSKGTNDNTLTASEDGITGAETGDIYISNVSGTIAATS